MFVCCAKHANSMRDLLLKLDGSHDVDELSRDKDHAAFLKVLDDLGYLTRRDPPPAMDGKSRLTWLAHAGLVYESRGKRIAIDPSAYPRGEPTRWAVNPVNLGDLNPLDAVLITHGDNDHFSPNALIRFPPKTPIVIPKAKAPKPYHVDMKRMLALSGMENVIEVEEWQELKFGDVKVVATPFRGEDWGLDLPTSTFYVTSPDLTIFANADSTSDEEAYKRLAKDYPRIDVAFLGVTGAAESYAMPPGFGYGDFYVKWIPEAKHEEWVELCNGPPQSVAAAKLLNARYAFGYAAGGAPFYTCAYSDRGTHAQFAKLLLESGGETKPLDFEVGVARSVPSA
jgi:L-ascorbate metabolism protein UlaG (beta-lactamase superfamily)